ncbi:hypothetical protein BN2476_530052 [Paraburkholderia piptadeniae]|uniref:Uncharacterized protein n=1 Tax=Paraburkholderia piptadeniae TaxID=1701573 RepID=A0A1N7SHY2_9BURK|nr:hypothetical protein BN2476_530052 [Paraburkholderia piptadeniae]
MKKTTLGQGVYGFYKLRLPGSSPLLGTVPFQKSHESTLADAAENGLQRVNPSGSDPRRRTGATID